MAKHDDISSSLTVPLSLWSVWPLMTRLLSWVHDSSYPGFPHVTLAMFAPAPAFLIFLPNNQRSPKVRSGLSTLSHYPLVLGTVTGSIATIGHRSFTLSSFCTRLSNVSHHLWLLSYSVHLLTGYFPNPISSHCIRHQDRVISSLPVNKYKS